MKLSCGAIFRDQQSVEGGCVMLKMVCRGMAKRRGRKSMEARREEGDE
jgi:hypothetical protein